MKSKKFNFALIALLMGTCFAFASSNPLKQATRYYFYNNAWHTTPPPPESGLDCEPELLKICSAEFETTPTSTTNDVNDNPDAVNEVRGEYK
ncbi:MAG: DUF6520 family protein [Sphingobacterium sp.]|jgi:hypothetical protein|nr:DUF6520 family protein [Sphingobacterium sp.]